MLKKVVCLLCCLALLCASALADGALVLSGQAIVDGSRVYYSGSIDSAQEGVYVMNTDGSGVSRLSGHYMTLLAADAGNLLAISYDEGDVEYAVVVLNAMGEKTVVCDSFVSAAIAADGRFYWGTGSCRTDGGDARTLIDDAAHSYYYYPLAVSDGWYYYLDWAENSESAYYEGDPYPTAARLCRMNLASGSIDVVSGYGTRFLGLDDNYIYYARNSFWLYDTEATDTYVAEVNSGVFRADRSTLVTDKLADFPADTYEFVSYEFLRDGVIYGTYSNYSGDNEVFEIIRMTVDGTVLPPLSLDNQSLTLHGMADGLLYASLCNIEYTEDDYIQHDLLYAVDPEDGSVALVSTPASDLFYFSETPPAIGVTGGRIYMLVFDNDAYAISFKSCAVDGTGLITLARGFSMANG